MFTRSLVRADALFPSRMSVTYVNEALKQESCIDYALISSQQHVVDFSIMDPDINFSVYLPLFLTLTYDRTGPSCRPNARSTNCDKPHRYNLDGTTVISFHILSILIISCILYSLT